MKIAVLSENKPFLGAQIVMVPFFKRLRQLFPSAEILVYSPTEMIEAVLPVSGADRAVVFRHKGGIKQFLKVLKDIRSFRPDIIFTLRNNSERDWLLNMFAGPALKIGFRRKWSGFVFDRCILYDKRKYRADNYLGLLRGFSVAEAELRDQASPTAAAAGSDVWLVPCGSKQEKLWPVDNYIDLGKRIMSEYNKRLICVLGPTERELYEHIKEGLAEFIGRVEVLHASGVEELMSKVKHCSLAVGNDCGPNHIPQISNVPTLVLFPGGANVGEWINSKGKAKAIVSSGPISEIGVSYVMEELRKAIV